MKCTVVKAASNCSNSPRRNIQKKSLAGQGLQVAPLRILSRLSFPDYYASGDMSTTARFILLTTLECRTKYASEFLFAKPYALPRAFILCRFTLKLSVCVFFIAIVQL